MRESYRRAVPHNGGCDSFGILHYHRNFQLGKHTLKAAVRYYRRPGGGSWLMAVHLLQSLTFSRTQVLTESFVNCQHPNLGNLQRSIKEKGVCIFTCGGVFVNYTMSSVSPEMSTIFFKGWKTAKCCWQSWFKEKKVGGIIKWKCSHFFACYTPAPSKKKVWCY